MLYKITSVTSDVQTLHQLIDLHINLKMQIQADIPSIRLMNVNGSAICSTSFTHHLILALVSSVVSTSPSGLLQRENLGCFFDIKYKVSQSFQMKKSRQLKGLSIMF